MKIIGVDYGTVRVGLAVMDTAVPIALPLRSITVGGIEGAAEAVAAAAVIEEADKIVVGLPRRLAGSGRPGDMERTVAAFISELKKRVSIEVDTEDERLTTALVEGERRDAGLSKDQFDKDAAAAAVLLESYAARHRLEPGPVRPLP